MLADMTGAILLQVWSNLAAREILFLGRAAAAYWQASLQLVEQRLPFPAPFALLTVEERSSVLRFSHFLEQAWLFENFACMDLQSLTDTNRIPALFGKMQGTAAWCIGPGTEAPPQIHRVPCSCTLRNVSASFAPLGHWCMRLANEDPATNLGPSGLVYAFPCACRPSVVVYRCKATARCPHRAGAVFALAQGLGNDKGPERPLMFMTFVRDSTGRDIFASSSSRVPVGSWTEDTWMTIGIRVDWQRRSLDISLEQSATSTRPSLHRVPFADQSSDAVKYLLLYNQTSDFVAYFTDVLIL
ncbi:Ide [Symbiodinium natans]|uniref:Ide protein n=1 Tax=Symbiodinium natans TaxID=878477 RepID=A0A812I6W9_9DINO|nr:Ide [Symbiodinium natans]